MESTASACFLHHQAFNLAPPITISRSSLSSSTQRPRPNMKPFNLVCRAQNKQLSGDDDISRRSVIRDVGSAAVDPAPENIGDDEFKWPGQVPGKQSWPELVGEKKDVAVATIEKENPYVEVIVLPETAPMDRMLSPSRVRVWVDRNGVVLGNPQEPRTG